MLDYLDTFSVNLGLIFQVNVFRQYGELSFYDGSFCFFSTDSTLHVLQQLQNQLLAPSPSHADSVVKRAIPEFPNLWELRDV